MTGRNLEKVNGLYWQKQAAKQLCKGLDMSSGDTTNGASLIVDALESQTAMLDTMLNPRKEITKTDYCVDGMYSGSVVQMWDEKTGDLIIQYLDATPAESLTPPLGEVCGQGIDYEYKHFDKVCLTDGTDTYYRYVCIPIINGVEQTPINIWFDDTHNKILEPTGTLTPCEIENVMPVEDEFFGNNATLESFNEITLFIPKCCEVEYTTDAGSVTLQAQDVAWVYVTSFDNITSNYTISSDCIENIQTILKLK